MKPHLVTLVNKPPCVSKVKCCKLAKDQESHSQRAALIGIYILELLASSQPDLLDKKYVFHREEKL
jgi:hypothetical protein